MSKTIRGSKPPGFDYWSRRPESCKNSKKTTKRIERQIDKKIIRSEISQI